MRASRARPLERASRVRGLLATLHRKRRERTPDDASPTVATAATGRSVSARSAIAIASAFTTGRSTAAFTRLRHALLGALAFFAFGKRKELATREANLALTIDAQHLDLDLLAFLDDVLDALDAVMRELR